MNVFRNELRQNRISIIGFGILLALFMVFVVTLYPSFAGEISDVINVFSNFTIFTDALNMDMTLITELIGYYGMEYEMLIGVLGGVFIAYLGGNLILKEEKEHTVEFLYTQPLSRLRILFEKILAYILLVLIFHLIIGAIAYLAVQVTQQEVDLMKFFLIHLAAFLAHLNLGLLTFGISEIIPASVSFLGPILVILMYLLTIINNMTQANDWLTYITPYGYTASAAIIKNASLHWDRVASNYGIALIVFIIGTFIYNRRDLKE